MSYDNLKLEKGLYTTGEGFTSTLEKLDPSENYEGTALEGLDAYQRQLKRFDIKVSGNSSDKIDKFFQTTDSAALFPEYISRAVRQGVESNDCISKLVASTTMIDSLDYRTIESIPSEDDKKLAIVAEGAKIPETTIKTKDKLVRLQKRGRTLVASYEAIKFQRLDLFTVTLKQMGASIAKNQINDLINAIVEDDLKIFKKEAENFTYTDLINLWSKFDPYTMTSLIVSPEVAVDILGFPQMQDSTAGLNFHATGNLITPLGADIIRVPGFEKSTILAIDKNYAVEMVKAGDIVTDFDKIIDRQLERATISTITGFSKIFNDASCVLDLA